MLQQCTVELLLTRGPIVQWIAKQSVQGDTPGLSQGGLVVNRIGQSPKGCGRLRSQQLVRNDCRIVQWDGIKVGSGANQIDNAHPLQANRGVPVGDIGALEVLQHQ